MPYVIEKGVPLPGKGDAELRDTLKEMDVGDSFLMEGVTARNVGTRLGIIGREIGARFLTRTCTGGARVWRVEGVPEPVKPRAKAKRTRKPKAVTEPAQAPLQAAQ